MLGEPVARQLQKDGYAVRILARNPAKAQAKFDNTMDICQGDVEQPATLTSALEGCTGVHINLAGGPKPEDYERIEHHGTANVVQMARQLGIRRLTYLSGTSVREENTWFYQTKAKFAAETAIQRSGIAYTIFRASWFMESLPLFVRGKRGAVIGEQPAPVHWVAAADYSRMVSQAYRTPAAENRICYVYGPEALPMLVALKKYCDIVHPGIKVSTVPIWLLSLVAALTRDADLKDNINLMSYFNKFVEDGDPTETNELLGTPTTTLSEWSQGYRKAQGIAG